MLRLGALIIALVLACNPAVAEVRAIVVGVDRYQSVQNLRGSVNDAKDIASELQFNGVTDIESLIDEDATMAAFDIVWKQMLARTEPGDILFLSFSGHGVRVPEEGARTTPDGFQKGFLLQPYDATDRSNEILRDEDLYDRFAVATSKGVKIFFVADACHAGAAVRGADQRAGARFRFQRFDTGTVPLAPQLEEDKPVTARPANPDVTVFSATDERLTIQEVVVDNSYRGALSYAVARGLRSVGTPLNVAALERFVSPLVRVLSGNRQIPQFTVPDEELEIFGVANGAVAATPTGASLPDIGLSVIGGTAPALDGTHSDQAGPAELIWDAREQQLLDANGDVLASRIGGDDIQAAVNARRVIEALRIAVGNQALDAGTTISGPNNEEGSEFFLKGERVTMTMRPGDFGYATMLDIAANGAVQLLWPIPQLDGPGGAVSGSKTFEAPVTGPFGADYVITILSRQPLPELQSTLLRLHNTADPLAFYAAFRTAASTDELRLSINAVFTCETLRSDKKCDTMHSP